MRTRNIRIDSDNAEMIKSIILHERMPDNIVEFDQGCQIIFEKHSFLNQNNYLDVVLLIQHKDYASVLSYTKCLINFCLRDALNDLISRLHPLKYAARGIPGFNKIADRFLKFIDTRPAVTPNSLVRNLSEPTLYKI